MSLILALYASDWVNERRPDLAKVAAFMVDGVNRWGLNEIIVRTCDLVTFWARCDNRTATPEVWAAHYDRFDNYRIIHCSLTGRQLATVRRHLIAMATADRPGSAEGNVCGDCDGTGTDIDTDGTLTGTVGTPLLCACTGARW
ncbi:hypothetical protein [Streptomyces sp. NPDC002889]|uniref:hypothetical protein n=1 Tax=Streptomyces sp. NPDC002889 TaxID=3364669 RepID=UPI0036B4EB9E